MERYIRFYLKFQGYTIGVTTLIFSVFMTISFYQRAPFVYPLEQYYDYRYMGSSALVLGLFWFASAVAFLYGVYYELKQFLLPFALMYLFDLFLILLRDLVMLWHDALWFTNILSSTPGMLLALYISCYLLMTLIVLARLFSSDPKPQAGDSFIRFNNNGIANPVTVEDEASLVVE